MEDKDRSELVRLIQRSVAVTVEELSSPEFQLQFARAVVRDVVCLANVSVTKIVHVKLSTIGHITTETDNPSEDSGPVCSV